MAGKTIIAAVTNNLANDRRMIRICTSLQQNGYEVELVGRNTSGQLPLAELVFKQHRLRCFFKKGPFFYAEYNIRLFLYLLGAKADIYNSVDADTLPAMWLASVIKGKKLVHDAHEYFTEVPELVNRPLIKKIWEISEKLFLPRASLIYTVSPSIAQFYQKISRKEVHVILNTPEFKENGAAKPLSDHIIIYQGALNKGRGLELIIDAMKQIDGILWIAGEGDLSDELRERTKQRGLDNKVIFWGMLSPEKLHQLTLQASIGYNVCQNLGKSYFYALSNKGFDYIHAGIPAITNNFPEYKQLNKTYQCFVLAEYAIDDIVMAINKLISDKGFYNNLRNNCLLASKNLNWQTESAKLIELYGGI